MIDTRIFRFGAVLVALLAVFAVAAACGDDDDDGDGETPTATATGEPAGETPTAPANGEDPTPTTAPSNGGESRSVTLMLNWVPNAHHSGVYIAQQEGYYEDAGLEVEIIEPGIATVDEVVGNGQVEFGISVQESVIPARAAGIPVVSIGAILQHNDSSLISLASEDIERPADLEGKTYGGFGGPLEEELISQLVTCDGGDPDEVTFVEVGAAQYLAGMQDDHYDVVWVFEGWDTLRFEEIDDVDLNSLRFIDYLDCIPDWYTPLFITSEDLIENDPELVSAFMEATTRGYEQAIQDPELAADSLIAGAPEIDEELVRLATEYYEGGYVDEGRQWGLQDEEIWEAFTLFLVQAGLIDEAIETEEAWTNEFLPDNE